jgi:hypothetical protein
VLIHLERGEILVGPGLLLFNSLLAAVQQLIHGLVVVHDVVRRLALVIDLLFLITLFNISNTATSRNCHNQCCGSGTNNFFNPGSRIQGQKDSGSRVKKIPDPGSGSASKNSSILTQNIVSKLKALGNMIRDVHPGSGSRI